MLFFFQNAGLNSISNVFFSFYQNRAGTLKLEIQWRTELLGELNTQEIKSMVSLCGCVTEKMGGITLACAIIWVRDIKQIHIGREQESKMDKHWERKNIVDVSLSSRLVTSLVSLSLKYVSNTHGVASQWLRALDTKLDWQIHFGKYRILI